MKIKYLFLTALATLTLAGCTSDEFMGDQETVQTQKDANDGIYFGGGFKAMTRNFSGKDAAALLGNRFVVGGFKDLGKTTYNKVFDNYGVEWQSNSAGTTESNTADWEYVGVTASPVTSITSAQTIKYWDFTASTYDFIAYSTGGATEVATTYSSGNVAVTAIDHDGRATAAYTLEADRDELLNCYVADMVTVARASFGQEVELQFRSLASKVRMAIYETVPGYSVKEVKFYNAHPATRGTGATTTATLIGKFCNRNKYTVSFDGNVAHVAMDATPTTQPTYFDAYQGFGTFPQTAIGVASNAPTWAPGSETPALGSYYTRVLPNEEGQVLELAVDYTLVSDDGSAEEIHVYGATAYIPAVFTKWLANYAYTYIFKISDNSNGWTSTTDNHEGLFPITFDAVVLDSEDNHQTTITTVATPSITTYQKGHVYSDGPEYNASTTNPIYIQVMDAGTLKDDLDATTPLQKSYLYTLGAGKTEAEVMDALNIRAGNTGGTITGRNGLVLTPATLEFNETSDASHLLIPGEDGNDITVDKGEAARFAATAGTYAYVYQVSAGTPTTFVTRVFGTQPTDWASGGYYTDESLTTAASGAFDATVTYYKQYTDLNNVYAVKVIKVQ